MATVTTKVNKRYDASTAKVEPDKQYTLEEAVAVLKQMPVAKFDESVDVSFRLGVDPKHAGARRGRAAERDRQERSRRRVRQG
jgi:ribosomal protein L1